MKKLNKMIICIMILLITIMSNVINANGDYYNSCEVKNDRKSVKCIINNRFDVQVKKAKNKFRFKNIKLKTKYSGRNKTYMDLKKITQKKSKQYRLKRLYKKDKKGHYYMLYKKQKFYIVALGNYFGKVGDKFKITLSNGKSFYAMKGDTKSDKHVNDRYAHKSDGSVIEFIIDTNKSMKYYNSTNGYVCNGNLNNNDLWRGKITSVLKIIE